MIHCHQFETAKWQSKQNPSSQNQESNQDQPIQLIDEEKLSQRYRREYIRDIHVYIKKRFVHSSYSFLHLTTILVDYHYTDRLPPHLHSYGSRGDKTMLCHHMPLHGGTGIVDGSTFLTCPWEHHASTSMTPAWPPPSPCSCRYQLPLRLFSPPHVCAHMYTRTHTHMCVHIRTNMHLRAGTRTRCMHAHVQTCLRGHAHVRMHNCFVCFIRYEYARMYTRAHVHTHTHAHVRTYTYKHAFAGVRTQSLHACTCTNVHTRARTRTYAYLFYFIKIWARTHVYARTNAHTHLYTYAKTCMCTHTHTYVRM
jgi:hypothetical protein